MHIYNSGGYRYYIFSPTHLPNFTCVQFHPLARSPPSHNATKLGAHANSTIAMFQTAKCNHRTAQHAWKRTLTTNSAMSANTLGRPILPSWTLSHGQLWHQGGSNLQSHSSRASLIAEPPIMHTF